jgi:hypothetical protein
MTQWPSPEKNKMRRKRQPCPDDPQQSKSSILNDMRQICFPKEFRIAMPALPDDARTPPASQPITEMPYTDESLMPMASVASDTVIAEAATCLWYLKTKYFKRDWKSEDATDDDPRTRRAIGRLNKCLDALKANGIEIDDPTNTRYPSGGENMMRPIEFQPTAGLTYERVTETIAPIVYRNGQLIQRGEVFVAVPMEDVAPSPPPTVQHEDVPMPNIESDTTKDAPESAIDDGARNDSLNNQHIDTSN